MLLAGRTPGCLVWLLSCLGGQILSCCIHGSCQKGSQKLFAKLNFLSGLHLQWSLDMDSHSAFPLLSQSRELSGVEVCALSLDKGRIRNMVIFMKWMKKTWAYDRFS